MGWVIADHMEIQANAVVVGWVGGVALITLALAQPFTYFGGTPLSPLMGWVDPCPAIHQHLQPKPPEIVLLVVSANGDGIDQNNSADGFERQGQSHL